MKKCIVLASLSWLVGGLVNLALALSLSEGQPAAQVAAINQLAETAKYNTVCNIKLKSDVEITPSAITFYRNGQAVYQIDSNYHLAIKQQKTKLTPQQKKHLVAYAKHIRSLMPKIKITSHEIINIALNTANSFTSFLGNNSATLANIKNELTLINTKINYRLDGSNTVYLDQEGRFLDEFYQGNADQQLQQIIASALAESMASLLQGVLFSGEKMSSVEAKVGKLKREINTAMTVKKAEIEQKAKALCQPIQQLVPLEEKLNTAIPQLANTKVFLRTAH